MKNMVCVSVCVGAGATGRVESNCKTRASIKRCKTVEKVSEKCVEVYVYNEDGNDFDNENCASLT